jgi:hypothetical protein
MRKTFLITCACVAATGYLIFSAEYCSPYAGAADSSGYLNSARFLLENRTGTSVPLIPGLDPRDWDLRLQEPLGFLVRARQGVMVPAYPVGYPIHLALAAMVVGLDRSAALVNIGLIIISGALMLAMGRRFGLSWTWSAAGVALLWGNPLFVMFVQRPMSDASATVWTMAAVWFALSARERWRWGILTGFAVALSVLVRPSDALILLPVGIATGRRWRAWLAMFLGGLPGAIFFARYNFTHYGGPLTLGFGNPSCLFGVAYAPPNAAFFLWWVIVLLSPLLVAAACGLPSVWRHHTLAARLLTAWIGVFVVFYSFYSESNYTWWSLRFILPVFPPLILSGLLVANSWIARGTAGVRWRYAPCLLFCAALAWQVAATFRLRAVAYRRESIYPTAADWMNSHVPSNAIVLQMLTSGASAYYSHFSTVRWDLMTPKQARQLYAAAQAAHLPIFACLIDYEPEQAFKEHLPGEWQQLATVREASFWRLKSATGVEAPSSN